MLHCVSEEQLEYAQAKLKQRGVDLLVINRFCDYLNPKLLNVKSTQLNICHSEEQLKYAQAKVKERGFDSLITILFCDYRKIPAVLSLSLCCICVLQ